MRADRRLWLNAEKDRVVEDGDPDAAFLLAAEGAFIADEDAEILGLLAPRPSLAQMKAVEPSGVENKAIEEPPATKGVIFPKSSGGRGRTVKRGRN